MLTRELRSLVAQVSQHARSWNDDEDHTVAAGLLTRSGRVVLGLNSYHFLGGPCGEVAALSNHAMSRPEDPIVAVAAGFGPFGKIVAPCGKCRQVFFDIDPDIRFVVREANGLTTRTAGQLLPFAYDWHHEEAVQRLYLWEGYEEAVRSGAKRQTIRVDDPFQTGEALLVFEKERQSDTVLEAAVTRVRSTTRGELGEQDAQRDGFETLADMQSALDQHYPGLGDEDQVDVVSFELHA